MEAAANAINTGDTAWMMISTALVLLMTPGLAFFYGGMVQTRHVVSTIFQSILAMGIVGIIWAVAGYSLVFGRDQFGLIGNLDFAFLKGVGQEPFAAYSSTIPHIMFMLFQCMFAIITPALITGSFAERIRFKAWFWITVLWSIFIYVPAAHSVWAVGGWIRELGALDFAGGLVVHMAAGFSALVIALMLRKRKDFSAPHIKPYDTGMIILGMALLWFGWFGFNAGSALAANGLAAHAFATTFFAGAAALVSWVMMDVYTKGKPSAIGAAIGAVAGLVTITPAAGYVTPMAAIVMGLLGGVVCNFSVSLLKEKFHLDDTLDVFGCHGVGGTLGSLLTGVFATKSVNPAGADGLLYGNPSLLGAQTIACLGVIAFSVIITFLIVQLIAAFTPIVVTEDEEEIGLDQSQHGELINSNFYSTAAEGKV